MHSQIDRLGIDTPWGKRWLIGPVAHALGVSQSAARKRLKKSATMRKGGHWSKVEGKALRVLFSHCKRPPRRTKSALVLKAEAVQYLLNAYGWAPAPEFEVECEPVERADDAERRTGDWSGGDFEVGVFPYETQVCTEAEPAPEFTFVVADRMNGQEVVDAVNRMKATGEDVERIARWLGGPMRGYTSEPDADDAPGPVTDKQASTTDSMAMDSLEEYLDAARDYARAKRRLDAAARCHEGLLRDVASGRHK